MTTAFPSFNLRNRIILKPVKNYMLAEVEKDVADNLQQYLSRTVYRSPLLEEPWLRRAYGLCVTTLDAFEQRGRTNFFFHTETQTSLNRARDLKNVTEVLERLLALPVQPFPNLPTEILHEIFKWAAAVSYPPWQVSSVLSQVQLWYVHLIQRVLTNQTKSTDPVFFACCKPFAEHK
ncbi:hypothetical protein DL96DRAFT_147302 [Flagelloscypha sp. PMI_526]|nr:hypothetical protein DL96DRAFT_147302 [Flagelloscypha sp. PMI_526]